MKTLVIVTTPLYMTPSHFFQNNLRRQMKNQKCEKTSVLEIPENKINNKMKQRLRGAPLKVMFGQMKCFLSIYMKTLLHQQVWIGKYIKTVNKRHLEYSL